ncbi:MAG: hypothetical protein AAFW73_09615 [Bacteroidota bacterium]
MSITKSIPFNLFVAKFPLIDLPLTLTNESSRHFSQQNDPFPGPMIHQFILPYDGEEFDDQVTEYLPCLQIPGTAGFKALIYWKAGLLQYGYHLVTFTDKGEFIDKRGIAGTKLNGDALALSVATIDEDWVIHIVGGVSSATEINYDPSNSQSFQLELLPTGEIINVNPTPEAETD